MSDEPPSPSSRPKPRGQAVPGSIAEIRLSDGGPDVAAFFDFDGTIIGGHSAAAIAEDRIRRRDVSLSAVAGALREGAKAGLGQAGFSDFLRLTAQAWAGRSEQQMEEYGERLYAQSIAEQVFPEVRELIEAHLQQNHTVVMISSATRCQVSPAARELGVKHVLCTELEVDNGFLTGEIIEPTLWGEGKAHAAQLFAKEQGIDLAKSYFYADGDEDRALMYLVGKPCPINPGKRLDAVARKRGWPVRHFSSRGPVSPLMRLRNVVGFLSVAPIVAAAAAVGAAKQDKRVMINSATGWWFDTLFGVAGVKLNITGEENLRSHRPAVFIFNHRNSLDAFLAAWIVRSDYTGVAKKEAETNMFIGPFGRLADVAFIDRSDRANAIEALKPLEELIRTKRLSILVAPEGTRVVGERVGPFKKGPFRMAMAAHVPVVPIVIRNADALGPHNATSIRPGIVDVAVLPPVSVTDWHLDELSDRVAEIRQMYVTLLEDWPSN